MMRPLESKLNTTRRNGNRTVVPKYIIVSEGYRTEPKYFMALAENKSIAGISSLIDIVVLQRNPVDSGISSPNSILNLLDRYMDSVKRGRYSLDLIVELMIESSDSMSHEKIDEFRSCSNSNASDYVDKYGFVCDVDEVLKICKACYEHIFGKAPTVKIPHLIDFREDSDHICVIVDRDKDSRTPSDMDEFIRNCKKSHYDAYISNPCFELWLLMHFEEEFFGLDSNMLLENPLNNGKRYTETELDRIVKTINPSNSYDKVDYDPMMFIHRIPDAIRTSKLKCKD